MFEGDEWRDPRVDPQKGDTVTLRYEDGETETRQVQRIERHWGGNTVEYTVAGELTLRHTCSIRTWREICEEADASIEAPWL